MKKWSIFMFIIVFLSQTFLMQCSFADEVSQNQIDFYSAIKSALDNNNNIKAMKKNLSSTERDIGIARSAMLPRVKFLEDFTVTDNPTLVLTLLMNQARATGRDLAVDVLNDPSTVTNFLTAGIIEQSIYNRKAMIRIKMAKKEYSANGYIYLREQEKLVNQVAQAYLRVSTNQELINVANLAVKDAKENLDIANVKYNKKGLYSDVLRAETALKKAEEKLVSSQRNLNVSKRNLGLLLGLESFVEVTNSIPQIQLKDINYYKAFALNRNDLKAITIKVENAKNNIKSAQADWYPTLDAIASYNFYNNSYPFGSQDSSYIAGAVLRWDLFDGNRRKYEILKAKDKEAETKEYLEGIRKEINFRVFEVYSIVEESQKELELANSEIKSAEEGKKLVLNRWQNSSSPFVDLLNAQANLDDVRVDVVNKQNNLKSALINLTFESGLISKELGLE